MICTYFLQTKALSNDYQQHQYNELVCHSVEKPILFLFLKLCFHLASKN